jgi:hypothetical protein
MGCIHQHKVSYEVVESIVYDGCVWPPGATIKAIPRNVIKLERTEIIKRLEWEPMEKPDPLERLKNIMIFTPVYRLEPETVASIAPMLVIHATGRAITWVCQADNPGTNGRENHLHQYNRARKMFLSGDYDAMLIIESDIIPPVDVLDQLESLNAPVGYGVYRFRLSNVINIFEKYPDPTRNLGESLSIKPHLLKHAVDVGHYPCSGAGFGCVLIRREVIENIGFRRESGNSAFCDTYFARDVLSHGYKSWANMGTICGHKDERGNILWPNMPS